MVRPEDADTETRFIQGKGRFVADLRLPDMLHLKIIRSVYARARLVSVKGGITHVELPALLSSVGEGASEGAGTVEYPVLAKDRVNYVGQPIAGVLGKTDAAAQDLLASVDVEYEPLKPIVDPEASLTGEPIHPGTSSNIFGAAHVGKTFPDPEAPVVVEGTYRNERVVPNPLEPRGVVAVWDAGQLTVHASTQSAHSFQEGLAESLHLKRSAVRVVQMDTGGAFGTKGGIYPEYVVAAHAAMKKKRPVRWIETRTEHLQAVEQGRGARARMTLHADRSGRILALRGDILVDGGAYSAGMGEWSPRWIGYQITGPYDVPRAYVEGRAVYTNKVPLGPYRGAGRPEAAFFMERIMDRLADELRMDPVDLRLLNARTTAGKSPTGLEAPATRRFLEDAVRVFGYRRRARQGNVGFSCFVLVPAARDGESARIAVRDGRLAVWAGGNVHGQGHETFVRSLLSKELKVSQDLIDLEPGDTGVLKLGVGSWGSRSAMVVGGAVLEAAQKLKAKVKGDKGRYTSKELLRGAYDVETFFRPEGNFNSVGANLVEADLDDVGFVRVREVDAYYDVGRVLNPPMLESQIAGGSLQAIGQVLSEGALYDEAGNVLSGSLADAGLLTSVEAPRVVVKTPNTRSSLPHGAKGVGESPTIGVPPALVRAIERQAGKPLTHTPLRPEELVR